MPTDKDLAEAIRRAAGDLCAALNKAGEARLEIECSVSPCKWQSFDDGTKALTDWRPCVSVRRVIPV